MMVNCIATRFEFYQPPSAIEMVKRLMISFPKTSKVKEARESDMPVIGKSAAHTQQVRNAVRTRPYDAPNWDTASIGFRDRISETTPPEPWLQNRVHLWSAGICSLTSPNDPVFNMNTAMRIAFDKLGCRGMVGDTCRA
jgi:hypothetical protein